MPDPDPGPDDATIRLRLLQTTDVHGHLLPFDYYGNRDDQPWGLARLATLIGRARQQAGPSRCLLLDTGDFLQGTPITDVTAQPGHGWAGPHPVIAAMNRLGYDGATLGNHEFNFGLDWLTGTLTQARFALTCANAVTRKGGHPLEDETLLPPFILLTRHLCDTSGVRHRLRIGLIGLVPPQIMRWDHAWLTGRLEVRDMVKTARAWIPRLRAAGADLVIVQAHTGIDRGPDRPMMENAARALAKLPGIDVLLTGHGHERFPGPAHRGIAGVDTERATLHGVPCLMAGFRADHLGQMDLILARDAQRGWHVQAHAAQLLAAATVPPCPALCRELQAAHAHTLNLTSRRIGYSDRPLHSYLALVRDDPTVQLVNAAQRRALTRALAGGPYAHLPLLSASAPFKTGGRGGPSHYTDMQAGPLRLRNIADLYGFPNMLCAVLVTGAQLRDWLERAAICFNRITPGTPDQTLLDPAIPGHDFDVIDGLSYVIDPSRPARYDHAGALIDPTAHRIRDLRHDGRPVTDGACFVMATNSYRAHGGGPFDACPAERLIHSDAKTVRDHVADYLAETGTTGMTTGAQRTWRFADMPRTTVILETGPGLRAYPQDIAALAATDLGLTETGFLRLRLPLPNGGPGADATTGSCESSA